MKGRTAVQRLLSLVLCLVLCAQLLPMTVAYADEPETAAREKTEKLGGLVQTAEAADTKLKDQKSVLDQVESIVKENTSLMQKIQTRQGGSSWQMFCENILYGRTSDDNALSMRLSNMNKSSQPIQKLLSCLEAGDAYFPNYREVSALRAEVRSYLADLKKVSNDILSIYTQITYEKESLSHTPSSAHMDITTPMETVLSRLKDWDDELEKSMILLQRINACAYEADNGAVVVNVPGAEKTAAGAEANMSAYVSVIESSYNALLADTKSYPYSMLTASRQKNLLESLSPAKYYLASLKRYWELRLEEGSADSEATIRALMQSMRSSITTADETFSAMQQGFDESDNAYRSLANLKSDISGTVGLFIAQLELKLENMGGVVVKAMSYADAKAKLDSAYADLNSVLLASAVVIKKTTGTSGITESAAKDYLENTAKIKTLDDVLPMLSELKSAMLTMILGADESGKPHLKSYIADLKTTVNRSRGKYSMPDDLTGLLAMQMADLYSGEWQIKNLPWGNSTVSDTITYQKPPVKMVGVRDLYMNILQETCDGLEEILREMAWRASIQEMTANSKSVISSDEDMLNSLRAEAQKRQDTHLSAMVNWDKVDVGTFAQNTTSDYIKEYVKEGINTLLSWRAAQDAYNFYLPYSTTWETLPGIAVAELEAYRETIGTYKTWFSVWKSGIVKNSDLMLKKWQITNIDNYNSHNSKYRPVMDKILDTMKGADLQQIQQAKTYQAARISPYSDEALAILQAQGTDLRTYLRLQLAELRVWDAALKQSQPGVVSVDSLWEKCIDRNLKTANGITDLTGYLHSIIAWKESETLYPVIHQYLDELEDQYNKYNHGIDVSEEIEAENIPTTDKTPQEMKELLAAKAAEVETLDGRLSAARDELDRCIEYLGTENEQYEELLAEVNEATKQLEAVKAEYDTLQMQLIYACLSAGDDLIETINAGSELSKLQSAAGMDEVIAAVKEQTADPAVTVYDIYLYILKQEVKNLGGDPEAIIADPTSISGAKSGNDGEMDRVRTVKDYSDAMLNLIDSMAAYHAGTAKYAPFPDFYLLEESELRKAIQDYQTEISTIYADTENQYDSMITAYELYQTAVDPTEMAWQYQNVMTIAQNYVGTSQRVEDLYRAVAQAEDALRRLSPPATEEEAEQRFKEAFMKYYYARREYLEFRELEMKLLAGEQGVLDAYGSNKSVDMKSNYHLWCWTACYAAIVDTVEDRNEIVVRLYDELGVLQEQLRKNYETAEKALLGDKGNPNDKNYAAYYLGAREISKEIILKGGVLRDRVDQIMSERDTAKANYEAAKKTLHFVDSLSLDNANQYTKIYSEDPIHAPKRLNVLTSLEKNTDIYNFVYSSSNLAYIEAYLNYEMCEARAADPNGIRESLLERMEVMQDKYALQVDTGATPGTGKILFFSVDYTDKDGFERKEYIFPNLDAEKKTGDMVKELTDTSKVLNQTHVQTMAELGQSGSSATPTQSLDSWSTDTYLLTTQYEMAKPTQKSDGTQETAILGFEAFGQNIHTSVSCDQGDSLFSDLFETERPPVTGQNKESSNSWSCRGMRLYHVDDLFGGSVYGYGGSDQTRTKLEFVGQQISALNKLDYSVSWSCDKMFHFDEEMKEFSIDRNVYDYRTEKVGEGSAAGKVVVKSDEDSEYLFKLDIADVYGAGVEELVTRYSDNAHSTTGPVAMDPNDSNSTTGENRVLQAANTTVAPCPIVDLGLAECLVYTIVYYDSNDCRHIVRVPVITSSLAWAVNHGISESDSIFGYAQQGDSLVFSAYLPDMHSISLEESYLRFETVEGWAASGQASPASKQHIAERINMLKETIAQEKILSDGTKTTELVPRDGEVRLTGMQIYKPGTYSASVVMDNGVIKPSVEGHPAYYFVSSGTSGESYAYGENVYLTNLLENYTEGTPLKPAADGTKYMVLIHTDFTSLSATADSPTVSVEYVTLSGRVVTSAAEDVATTSHDYYGYWPGVNNEDITPVIATGQSGELKMLFEINDLNYFNKIKIAMDSTARDDWQITKVEIMKLNSLGERIGTWTPVEKNVTGTILSDRTYDRVLSGDILLSKEEKVLIQPGDTKEILIRGDNAQVEEQEDIDWEEKRYYMDLDTAMADLGFSKERANYTVKVKVAGETDANTIDGDCGSVNPFYFQLVFANGKSGYVLANQQLSGDGFRTGYNETFTICTNRDYGDLRSVRIIPDDMSSNSDTFDKLNIDSIEVSRQSNEAVNRTWVVNNVGWIEFDYHDEAEAYSISGRDGRAEGNLARNFNVNYSTYSTKLLFAIETSQPDPNTDQIQKLKEGQSEEVQKQIDDALTNQRQFQGEVSLNLTYRDSKGNVQHETFDMVQAMAAYANKKITTQESTDENGNIDQSETVSDTSYMFRMCHTDRFELEIRDAVQLLNASIIATGVADQSCFWKLNSFAVSMITEAGMLNINDNNEYEKTNAVSAERVTHAKGMPYTLWVPARHTEEFQFYFEDNEINVDLEEETWEVAAARVPDSDNDVANVYVYLTDDSKMPNAMMALIRYANSYGISYQAAQREMLKMEGAKGFYINSIDVSGMSVLNRLILDTLDAGTRDVTIDRVVIQQIRSDVVINTYTCNLNEKEGSMSDGGKLTIYPGGTTNQGGGITYNDNKQVLTLGFGDNTETARLVAENRDIAVAIRYTTTNDTNGREYNSPYIYLTDQQVKSIAAGSTAQITFHEPYVDQIKGIVLLATGKIKAEFRMGSVGVYEKDETSGEDTCIRWYSFGSETEGVALKADSRLLKPGADNALDTVKNKLHTVCPLTVRFTTGTTEVAADPQTSDPIKMVVSYVDAEGNSRTKSFPNIRNMLIDGGFGAGETATIRVMLMGVKELTGIAVEPYSDNLKVISQDDWYLSSFALEMNQEISVYRHSAAVERAAVQGTPLVMNASVVRLSIEAKTQRLNDQGKLITQILNSKAGPINLMVKPGQAVSLNPMLTGTSQGYILQAVRESGLVDVTGDTTILQKTAAGYTFQVNTASTTAQIYHLTFTSVEDSTVSEAVTITVSGSGETEIPVEPQSNDPFGIQYFNEVTRKYEIIHDVTLYVSNELPLRTSSYLAGDLTWTSADSAIATVTKSQDGQTVIVSAKAVGTTTIQAVDDKGNQESCTIHVNELPAETGT